MQVSNVELNFAMRPYSRYEISGYETSGYEISGYEISGYEISGYKISGYEISGNPFDTSDLSNIVNARKTLLAI